MQQMSSILWVHQIHNTKFGRQGAIFQWQMVGIGFQMANGFDFPFKSYLMVHLLQGLSHNKSKFDPIYGGQFRA